jgi:acetyltransferase-like isoleucine patch superfamily enzyme
VVNKKLLIVHNERPIFDEILMNWRSLAGDREIEPLPLDQLDAHLAQTDRLKGAGVFIALDSWHLNFRRLAAMHRFVLAGLVPETLISVGAHVGKNVKMGANCYIAPGAVIEDSVQLGNNVFVGAFAHIGRATVIKHSVWISRKSEIGQSVEIGSFTVVGENTTVGSGLKIGSYVAIEGRPRVIESVAERTFYLPEFNSPVQILKSPER